MSNYSRWNSYYHNYPLEELGWELGKPRPILVEYMQRRLLPQGGKALDLCCGAGTNTVYLAKNGYGTIGLDISTTAIGMAKKKAEQANVEVDLVNASFVDLPFADGMFGFVHDMGCFHHVKVGDRDSFISGIHRVLKQGGNYMLTCFSYRNGSRWNHFTKKQIIDLFGKHFNFGEFHNYPSVEGDGVTRFFYTVLMKGKIV